MIYLLFDMFLDTLQNSWRLLLDASVYILFGITVGGLLKVFLSPETVARHLGKGRFISVIKAALFGIPLPLCSCGVLPAAASLKKQGANNGATTAFLISTPESGVDSISITYALLDPIMTVARPVAAFLTATTAGFTENLLHKPKAKDVRVDLLCPVDGCCDGNDCEPADHNRHHSIAEKFSFGIRYAFVDLWGDLAVWFLIGILLGGLITVLMPESLMTRYLGGGLPAMLIMLAAGIPLYICATASTPIAAALILKGVSPGAALVFLLAGPATNIASLSVLLALLGKRTVAVYLTTLSIMSVLCGLLIDKIYAVFSLSAQAVVGSAAEIMPYPLQLIGALLLLTLSIKPVWHALQSRLGQDEKASCCDDAPTDNSCGCSNRQ